MKYKNITLKEWRFGRLPYFEILISNTNVTSTSTPRAIAFVFICDDATTSQSRFKVFFLLISCRLNSAVLSASATELKTSFFETHRDNSLKMSHRGALPGLVSLQSSRFFGRRRRRGLERGAAGGPCLSRSAHTGTSRTEKGSSEGRRRRTISGSTKNLSNQSSLKNHFLT